MSIVRRIFGLLTLSLLLSACQDQKAGAPVAAKPAAAVPAASDNAMPAMAAATQVPLPAAANVGVSACDAYLALYRTCIETKIPAMEQPRYREAYLQGVDALKKAVNATGNTAKLAESCGMARDAAKQAFAKFGCDEF